MARVFSALLITSLEEKSHCSIALVTAASVSAIGRSRIKSTTFYHNNQVELGQWDIQVVLVGEGSPIEIVLCLGGVLLMTNSYAT